MEHELKLSIMKQFCVGVDFDVELSDELERDFYDCVSSFCETEDFFVMFTKENLAFCVHQV